MSNRGSADSVRKQTRKPRAATPARTAARGRGRPPARETNGVNQQSILEAALKLTKTCSLQDLSIVIVARALDVTPALIHYYLGGRDWLTSGVMNLFYKELVKKLPPATDDWRADIADTAQCVFEHVASYPGVTAYLVSNSRFRIYQLGTSGDQDYGPLFLDRFIARIRAAGLSPQATGLHAHLMLEFIITTGHSASHHLFPREHRKFLEKRLAKLDPDQFPNIIFARQGPLGIDGSVAFREGLSFFMLGLERDVANIGLKPRGDKKRR